MRGGTSKAIFFRKEDMPEDRKKWSDFLLDVMGSPDLRQIDGLGGANSLTSKVAIVSKSEVEGIDIDYTFAQVSINQELVDMKGNCGNISSAVAPYAIDEGLISVDDDETLKKVIIRNTNTEKIIDAEIALKNGRYNPVGTCEIPGVPGVGSKITLTFHDSEGAVTGKLLPTGKTIDTIETSKGMMDISIVDAANPLVFMRASDIGMTGNELPNEMTYEQLKLIEEVRSIAAELCGFASRNEASTKSPAVPKATIISYVQDFKDIKGNNHLSEDMDLTVRMMSMQKPHQALAITGAVCIATAAVVEGTIVEQTVGIKGNRLRIAHPGGIMETESEVKNDVSNAIKVSRTARRIMEGYVFTHKNYKL